MRGYDVVGSIAILKFDKEKKKEKVKIAHKLLNERKNIKTVLEKIGRVKGRLRKIQTRYLTGEKNTETIHKESGCLFKLNIEKCYFSPRLSGERLEIAKKIKSKEKVLVMFSGVGPYSVVIGKLSKCRKVVSVELSKQCNKYARENVRLNKLENVEIIQGDVKKIVPKLREKFDVIVMPRPQLKEIFLKEAFKVSKKGTRIYYYDFGRDLGKVLEKIFRESKKVRKKIEVMKVKKAGEIAPYKYRFRIDFVVG